MKYKFSNRFFVIIAITISISIILITLIRYKISYVDTIEKGMENANVQFSEILKIHDTKVGSLVFYVRPDSPKTISAGFLEKNILGYKWVYGSGVADFDDKYPLTYKYFKVNEVGNKNQLYSLGIMYGTITDKNIKKIQFKSRVGNVESTQIVESNLGRFWYSIVKNGEWTGNDIIGMDDNNNIIKILH